MQAALADSIDIDGTSLIGFLDGLFDRLARAGNEPFAVAPLVIGGLPFLLRSTDAGTLERYRNRLAATSHSDHSAPRIDIVAALDIGWPSPRWVEPNWQMHVFDQIAEAGGYDIAYPYFDRQWIARQRRTGHCVYFLDRIEDLPPWDSGSPLRLFLHWSLSAPRRRMVHAASLGVDGKGVLITGPGGSGKSGTTLAGLAAGFSTVGDDYLLLDQVGTPIARPLYRLLKQDSAGIARVGLQAQMPALEPNWQGKFEFSPDELFPGGFVETLELGAILLPVVAHARRTLFETVHRSDAVRFLTLSMLDQLPIGSASTVMFFAGLTARLPVYRMHLSEDPKEIAAAVRRVIVNPSLAT